MWPHQDRSYGPEVNTGDHRIEPSTTAPPVGHSGTSDYEIRVRGHLGPHLAAWFDGLELDAQDDGVTVIRGPVVDQAALHGLLHRLRDLGIPLLSLTEVPSEAPTSAAGRRRAHEPTTTPPGATP